MSRIRFLPKAATVDTQVGCTVFFKAVGAWFLFPSYFRVCSWVLVCEHIGWMSPIYGQCHDCPLYILDLWILFSEFSCDEYVVWSGMWWWPNAWHVTVTTGFNFGLLVEYWTFVSYVVTVGHWEPCTLIGISTHAVMSRKVGVLESEMCIYSNLFLETGLPGERVTFPDSLLSLDEFDVFTCPIWLSIEWVMMPQRCLHLCVHWMGMRPMRGLHEWPLRSKWATLGSDSSVEVTHRY